MRILVLAGLAFSLVAPAVAQTEMARPIVLENETILRVGGEGEIRVRPETVEIEIGVETSAKTSPEALRLNNEKSIELVEAIRALGIDPDDVRTSDLSVEPRYAEDEDSANITGWVAVNELTVRTEKIEQIGEIIPLLFEAGGNTLDGPDFGLTPETRELVVREAEAQAISEARRQAEATAEVLGMRVARLLLVSDSRVRFRGGRGIVVTGSRIRRQIVPIEPGDIRVSANYDVEYALVPR